MGRDFLEIRTVVEQRPKTIKIFEFPIIEDLVTMFVNEAAIGRVDNEPISTQSRAGRDIKDFMIKSNVSST